MEFYEELIERGRPAKRLDDAHSPTVSFESVELEDLTVELVDSAVTRVMPGRPGARSGDARL